jgi:hypothetical protein
LTKTHQTSTTIRLHVFTCHIKKYFKLINNFYFFPSLSLLTRCPGILQSSLRYTVVKKTKNLWSKSNIFLLSTDNKEGVEKKTAESCSWNFTQQKDDSLSICILCDLTSTFSCFEERRFLSLSLTFVGKKRERRPTSSPVLLLPLRRRHVSDHLFIPLFVLSYPFSIFNSRGSPTTHLTISGRNMAAIRCIHCPLQWTTKSIFKNYGIMKCNAA